MHFVPSRLLWGTTGAILMAGASVFAGDPAEPQAGPSAILDAEARINDDTGAAAQRMPSVAMHPSGPTVVCWTDERRGPRDIFFQLYGRRGYKFGTLGNVRVNDDATPLSQLSVARLAMDNNGHFIVVWAVDGDGIGPRHVFARRYFANGNSWGGIVRVDDGPNDNVAQWPTAAMDEAGRTVIAWADRRAGGEPNVYVQAFDRDGRRLGVNTLAHTVTTGSQIGPVVSMNRRGHGILLWEDWRSGAAELYGRRFGPGLAPKGAEFIVAAGLQSLIGTDLANYDAAVHSDGKIVVCWNEADPDEGSSCRGRMFDSTGAAVTEVFHIDEPGPAGETIGIRAAVDNNGSTLFTWTGIMGSAVRVYTAYCTQSGVPYSHIRTVSESTGVQAGSDVAADAGGNTVFVWMDDRTGDFDIYVKVETTINPTAMTAGSGFDSMVPISWEPYLLQSDPDPGHFSILRFGPEDSDIAHLGSVHPPTPWVPGQRFDWIDTTAVNGVEYRYRVLAVVGGPTGNSATVSATPAAGGHSLRSSWASRIPVIDGRLSPGEWDGAAECGIASPDAQSGIRLFIQNTGETLYLAVDDSNDFFVEAGTSLGFVMDPNRDREWDTAPPGAEGAVSLTQSAATFNPFWGRYPDALGASAGIPAEGIDYLALAGSGHVQHEAAIDLRASPLRAEAGATIGFAVCSSDPGSFYANEYGYSGQWPVGFILTAARTLGSLTLASETGVSAAPSAGPESFSLGMNFPNPFNPVTTVPFRVRESGRVTLKIFDALGNEAAVLADGQYEAGSHTARLDASGLASGIYVVRMEAEGYAASRKIALVK